MIAKLQFIQDLPSFFHLSLLGHPLYRWMSILVIALLGWAIGKIVRVLVEGYVTAKLLKLARINFSETQKKLFSKPLAYFSSVLTLYLLFPLLGYSSTSNDIIKRFCYILFSLIGTWFAMKITGVFELYFSEKTKETDTKFDDILIPLLSKSAKVLVFCIGLLFIARSLTIDVENVIAGLGIGGLAFAFAAKDTLANFFGSLMIILDRPFDVGDAILLPNGVEGSVEEVGFRSTKVRTFYDALIYIPNSSLTNMHIENNAKRKYRRMRIFIGVQYDTPAEKIEAFCEGIRQIILKHPHTRKDLFNVYFHNFSASSLDILVHMFWQVPDFSAEAAERHRFLLDVLRLGSSMGVEFAFPTQTVHLYNEDKNETTDELKEKNPNEFYQYGQKKAEEIISKPFTAKDPRSKAQGNSLDEVKF